MILARLSLRYLWRHPWLLALSIVGVGLGVAVVVAIDIANTSAGKAFELSADAVSGKATHVIRSTDGGLPDSVYVGLKAQPRSFVAAPVVDGYVRLTDCRRRVFQLIGIDPLADAQVRSYTATGSLDPAVMIAQPSIAMTAATARSCGLEVSDSVEVVAGGVSTKLVLGGAIVADNDGSSSAMEGLLIADVSTAQEIFGTIGQLSRIDLVVEEPTDIDRDIVTLLPDGMVVDRSTSRSETLSQMTRAFDVNLRALSLLALIVGMFLIYNSMTFSVVQRRPLIGRLRALGVSRKEIFALITGEAAAIGVAGTVAGILVGVGLATVLVDLVTRTINDLYFAVTVARIDVSAASVAKGVGLGVGVTVLAALRPAWEATAVPVTVTLQRSSVEAAAHKHTGRLLAAGVGVAVVAGAVLSTTEKSIGLSYVGLLLVILSFVAATPALVLAGSRVLRPVMGLFFGVIGRMASNAVGVSLSRTGIAIAALAVAVAATIGVGVMVGSFRSTVQDWLGYSLQADVYIQAPSVVVRRRDSPIRPQATEAIRATSGVSELYTVSRIELRASGTSVDGIVIDPGPRTPSTFKLRKADADVWSEIETRDVVLVSEPFSFRYGVDAGDYLELETDSNSRRFRVGGVYFDYGSDMGAVLFSRTVYTKHFSTPSVNGVALYLKPDADIDAVMDDIRDRTSGVQELYIQSNRSLRDRSLQIFDRTFVVTNVLRLLTIVVAFIGVLSALMALQLEKSRELAVLRANGMTPGQVWGYVTLQTGIMGVLAGVLAIPLGISLAALLVFVINKRSFGWTLQFEPAVVPIAVAFCLALAAAVLAGLYPASRMSKTRPSEALRDQ